MSLNQLKGIPEDLSDADLEYLRFVAGTYAVGLWDLVNLLDNIVYPTMYLDSVQLRALWEAFLGSPGAGEADLFVNIPFCGGGCLYCPAGCFKDAGQGGLARSLQAIDDQAAFYGETFARTPLRRLRVAGGSPGTLSPRQLDRLLAGIAARFAFRGSGERAVELFPDRATRARLEVLARREIDRVVLKARALDPETLRLIGRPADGARTLARAVRSTRRLGLRRGAAVELTLGLPGQTPGSFESGLLRAADSGPEEIVVRRLRPDTNFLELFFWGDIKQFNRKNRGLFDGADETLARLAEKAGYRILESPQGKWRFVRGDWDPPGDPGYDENAPGSGSILGLGAGARGRIFGSAAWWDSARTPGGFDPRRPSYAAADMDRPLEMIRYALMHLRADRSVSLAGFRTTFGASFAETFPTAVKRLAERGIAALRDGSWRMETDSDPDRLLSALCLVGLRRVMRDLEKLKWSHAAVGASRIDILHKFEESLVEDGMVERGSDRHAVPREGELNELLLTVGSECEARCSFCVVAPSVFSAKSHPYQFVPLERAQDELAYAYRIGCRGVLFSGGEPTLNPELVKMAEYAKRLGYRRIQVESNGLNMADRSFLKRLIGAGVHAFCLSVHSHTAEMERVLSGHPTIFKKKLEALRGLIEEKTAGAPIETVFTTAVVTDVNLDHLVEYAQFFADFGIERIEFKTLNPRHLHELDPGTIPDLAALARKIRSVIEWNENGPGLPIRFADFPPCCLDPERELPSRTRHALIRKYLAIGKTNCMLVSSMGRQFNSTVLRRVLTKTRAAACRDCHYFPACEGVWTGYAYYFGTSQLAPLDAPPVD